MGCGLRNPNVVIGQAIGDDLEQLEKTPSARSVLSVYLQEVAKIFGVKRDLTYDEVRSLLALENGVVNTLMLAYFMRSAQCHECKQRKDCQEQLTTYGSIDLGKEEG